MTRRAGGVERDDVERLGGGDAEAAPLADGVVDDAGVAAEHAAVDMDDVAGLAAPGQQALDHVAVMAGRHEADVLAVGLVGDVEAELARQRAHLAALASSPSGKRRQRKLLARGGEQEIALVAIGVGGAIERPAAAAVVARDDVMAGRQDVGAEIAAPPRTDRRT